MVETLTFFNAAEKTPREYQMAIFERAKHENVLAVIPTGLGKTLIAGLLSAHFLQLSNCTKKCLILAPTRPLINQHYESFQEILNLDAQDFVILTGQTPAHQRIELFQNAMICLMTPETLINDLNEKRYDLTTTTLIVFDEAHHALGDYAYTGIATLFEAMNPHGRTLGLTASPGANPARILTICANLKIPMQNIEYRNKESDDVKEYVYKTNYTYIPVDMTDLMIKCHRAISEILQHKIFSVIQQTTMLNLPFETNPEKVSQRHCVDLHQTLTAQLKTNTENARSLRVLISLNSQVMKLMHILKNIESEGLKVAFDSLERIFVNAQKADASKADLYLSQELKLQQIYHYLRQNQHQMDSIHPKLLKLTEIVTKELTCKAESRILIFTKFRDSVNMIVDFLTDNSPPCKPSRFVGQAKKSKEDKGMSQKLQIQILNEFKEGTINTLVATNVGEEGLDIAECNLVIFYDNSASEIRNIQRAGRTGRSAEGNIYILYTKGTSDEISLKMAQIKTKRQPKQIEKVAELSANPEKVTELLKADKNHKEDNKNHDRSVPKESKIDRIEKIARILPPKNQATLEMCLERKIPEIFCKEKVAELVNNTVRFPVMQANNLDYDLCVKVDSQIQIGIHFVDAEDLEINSRNLTRLQVWKQYQAKIPYYFLFVRDARNDSHLQKNIAVIMQNFGLKIVQYTDDALLGTKLNLIITKFVEVAK